MFNSYDFHSVDFCSNPAIPERRVVEAGVSESGKVTNKVVTKPWSNKPFYDGIIYQPETMSLRAKLNMGIALKPVANVNIDNDPAVVQRNMLKVEQDLMEKVQSLEDSQPLND